MSNENKGQWSIWAGLGWTVLITCRLLYSCHHDSNTQGHVPLAPEVGIRQQQKKAIESVFTANIALYKSATSATDLVRGMRAINLSACPAEFQKAYLDYVDAWSEVEFVCMEAKQWNQRYDR